MAPSKRQRRWVVLVAILSLSLATLAGRMLLGTRRAHQQAQIARQAGDREAEARHLRHALAFHMPLNPWTPIAAQRLRALSTSLRHTSPQRSIELLFELRATIIGLRSFYQPLKNELTATNRALSRALPRAPKHKAASPTLDPNLASRLATPPETAPTWTALGLAGFILWILGAAVSVIFGMTPTGSITKHMRFSVLVGTIGFAMFVVGMAAA